MSIQPPYNMGSPPYNMGSPASGSPGGPIVLVPMTDLLQPPHAPKVTGFFPIVIGAHFQELAWDPSLRAQVVLAEFGAANWKAATDPGEPGRDP